MFKLNIDINGIQCSGNLYSQSIKQKIRNKKDLQSNKFLSVIFNSLAVAGRLLNKESQSLKKLCGAIYYVSL